MRRRALPLLITALVLGTHSSSRAQQPLFSAQSELVVLYATVTDGRGAYVRHLSREAFSVFEEGEPQAISFMADTDTPVTVGLLIDNSTSMMPSRGLVIAAARAFADASHPQDEIFALAFNEHVRPALPPDRPFTDSPATLQAALDRTISARGQTALYDAVRAGLEYAARGSRQRKVLVIVSDGGANASRAGRDDILREAPASSAVIYTLALHDTIRPRSGDPRLLRDLARLTGGETFRPQRPQDVTSALREIAADIRHTYTIGYVPRALQQPNGALRRVRVDAKAPDGRRLRVRSRGGYIVGPAQ